MKFMCLGYAEQTKLEDMPEEKLKALMEKCLSYDDELKAAGHWAGGYCLKEPTEAVTIRQRGGKVDVTDGPFAETKEQIGGVLILEAKDLNQAIALMSKHPGTGFGAFEVRPLDEEFAKMVEERAEKLKVK